MSDSHCRFCGQAIIFRMMQGRCVPMHPEGGCPGHSSSRDDDEKKADCLYATSCPKCDAGVYFLRHNGGCTWLDDIPYPWPKHACFLDQSDPIPDAWKGLATTAEKSIIVRFLTHSSGNQAATLTPVDKKLRKWFRDLGTFRVIFKDSLRAESIDRKLALVTVSNFASARTAEFRAVTSDGQSMLLIPRRS